MTLLTTALILTSTATAATTDMRHSRDVIRFFDNHHWLRAPNQPNCQAVPWTRSCKTARRLYRHHHQRLAQFEHEYQYAWWEWMPKGWQNIGACETGYGHRPGNFRHNSGTYQGAFGFARSSWDTFVGSADPKAGPYPREAYDATPRQQYEVALAIWRRYGLSGWGCRGAFNR